MITLTSFIIFLLFNYFISSIYDINYTINSIIITDFFILLFPLFFHINFTIFTKTKKRLLWSTFYCKCKKQKYTEDFINLLVIIILQYYFIFINNLHELTLKFFVSLSLLYIMFSIIYNNLFKARIDINLGYSFIKNWLSNIKENLPILIGVLKKLVILGIFLYIIRLLFIPKIDDIFTYFIIVLSLSLYIYFIIFFIRNISKNDNVSCNSEIFFKSLNDLCNVYNAPKIILGILFVVLIYIVKIYFITTCLIFYDKGLKIKIPLLEYNIIDKKNIINFFINNKINFTRLNLTRINFLELFKSLFNLSIKMYI